MSLLKAGTKFDGGKPRMGLLPGAALHAIARGFTYGARKYDDHNWRRGMKWSRLQDALLRHLTAWSEGEARDPESGLSHLAHAGCCLLMLLWYEEDLERYGHWDDRWREPEGNTPPPPMGG